MSEEARNKIGIFGRAAAFLAALLAFCLLACCTGASVDSARLADDDGAEPVLGRLLTAGGAGIRLTGLSLDGGAAGIAAGGAGAELNGRPIAAENVRAVFEQDEWISLRIGYEYGGGFAKFGVWMFPHRDIGEYGTLEDTPGCAYFAEYELPYETYPQPLEDEFSIPAEAAPAGLYDMLFTMNGTIAARLVFRLYGAGELSPLADSELIELQTGRQ